MGLSRSRQESRTVVTTSRTDTVTLAGSPPGRSKDDGALNLTPNLAPGQIMKDHRQASCRSPSLRDERYIHGIDARIRTPGAGGLAVVPALCMQPLLHRTSTRTRHPKHTLAGHRYVCPGFSFPSPSFSCISPSETRVSRCQAEWSVPARATITGLIRTQTKAPRKITSPYIA